MISALTVISSRWFRFSVERNGLNAEQRGRICPHHQCLQLGSDHLSTHSTDVYKCFCDDPWVKTHAYVHITYAHTLSCFRSEEKERRFRFSFSQFDEKLGLNPQKSNFCSIISKYMYKKVCLIVSLAFL